MRAWPVLLGALVLVACSSNPTNDGGTHDAGGFWQCPAGWVALSAGGCGPAVLACVDDGGALGDACTGVDFTHPAPAGDPDAGGMTLFRLPDGEIGGGWSAPESVAQAPADDFTPDAGIPSCPAGWTRLADGTCDPQLPTDCGAGAWPLPGGSCAPGRASECAASEWPDVSTESGSAPVLRVRAGADDATADGSAARPFGSIAAAVISGGDGAWIVLAAGTYPVALTATGSIHVVGVCASRVTLVSSAGSNALLADGSHATIDVRGVDIQPAGNGIGVRGGAHASLRNVHIQGAQGLGIDCTGPGSTLDMRQSAIDGTRTGDHASPVPSLSCSAGAHVTAQGVVLADSLTMGARASGAGTDLQFTDGVISATHTGNGGEPYTEGLAILDGASAMVQRTVFDANVEEAALVQDAGSMLTVQDSIVRGSQAGVTGPWGVRAESGGTLVVNRSLFDGLHYAGLTSNHSGASIVVTDSVVRGVVHWGTGTDLSIGMQISHGARITANHVLLDANREGGIVVSDDGSVLEMNDSIVRGSLPASAGYGGFAVELDSAGAQATITRSRLEGNANYAVGLSVDGASVLLDHTLVIGTHDSGSGGAGSGLVSLNGGTAICRYSSIVGSDFAGAIAAGDAMFDITDSRFDRNGLFGVSAIGAATLRIQRSVVRGATDSAVVAQGPTGAMTIADSWVSGPAASAPFGRGLEAVNGGQLTATRVLVSSTRDFGALSFSDGSSLTLEDVILIDTSPSSRGFGAGVMTFGGAVGTLDRVAVQGANAAGVACVPDLDVGGHVSARDLMVRGVLTSTLEFGPDGMTPAGRSVAYGLHVGENASLDATRVTVIEGGYGFFASNGTLALHTGSISRQLDAAGAYKGAQPTLESIAQHDNALNVIVDDTLPSGSSLPPPDPVCPPGGCI